MAHWSSCAVHNEPALPKGECDCGNGAPEMSPAAKSQLNMMDLLSEPQVKAWCDGRIENLRFDPENGLLHYRITDLPRSHIVYKVLPERIRAWRENIARGLAINAQR